MTTRRVVNVPNTVSFVRLLLIPLFMWLAVTGRTAWAGGLLGVIGATDWVDGYLARRLDQVTELGKMLDPVADRAAVAVAVILGLVLGVLPLWFGVAIVVREVAIGVGAAYGWAHGVRRLDVRWLGKFATLLLYFAVAGFYVADGLGWTWLWWASSATGAVGVVAYYVVAVSYLGDLAGAIGGARSNPGGRVESAGGESEETSGEDS